ncbi:hypothetical protein BOTNAR_0671g00020 [Botryotinia narcissicola]|uniref:Extracellular membrane protein CFEM domain-containing protein n=1 Tax=Botryotinia narcissicola TaxID=278944 RepID=A0A4Z1HAZ8_9HELO|nr:hypothetical protein BOTNAR_0671g00020 [Botryotinia narcissicola]
MKASNIIQALIVLAFQARTSMAAAVTTPVKLEDALESLRNFNYNVTKIDALNQRMDYSGPLCPELAAQVTTSQALIQQTSPPLIGGCRGVAPHYQLQCYKENCREPAGPPGSSCASYPPDYQLACYQSKCDPKPETVTYVEVALESPVGASSGQDCNGVAPEYELECFYRNCPMSGPPGFSCASLSPQYQIDCYKKRCHEVYTSLASEPALQTPNSVQQTPNTAQQSPGADGGCISAAPENQPQCYRDNCPMSGPIGYSCGTLPLDYQLQCYKAHCDNKNFIGAGPPVLRTLGSGCENVALENQEECFQKKCFKLFCASLPVQYQLQCYRQHCSIPDLSALVNRLGNSLGEILDSSSASGSSNDDGSSASGSSDDDGVNDSNGKRGSFSEGP